MKLETTEPTLNQSDDSESREIILEEFGIVLLIKKLKIGIKNCEKAYFKPNSSALLMNSEVKKIDLQTLSYLCYPKGVRVFHKPTGFKTFNFLLTLENGEKLYCYCLAFREKCEGSLHDKLCSIFQEDENT